MLDLRDGNPKLVVVRHGESYGNRDPLHWKDPNSNFLTLAGVRQAEAAGVLISNTRLDFGLVMASGIIRAQQTLRYIMELADINQHSAIFDEDLNERIHWPEVEPLEDLRHRVMQAVEDHAIPILKNGENVLLVTHCFWMRELLGELAGIPTTGENRYWVRNGQPHIISYVDGKLSDQFDTLGDPTKFPS